MVLFLALIHPNAKEIFSFENNYIFKFILYESELLGKEKKRKTRRTKWENFAE